MGKNESFGENPRRVGIAERWWAPVKLKLTDEYDYISKNAFIKFFYYFVLYSGLVPLYIFCYFYWGLRFAGLENARAVRNRSAVTISNHVHDFDSVMITRAFFPNTPYFVALKHNLEMFFIGFMVRALRCAPLPEPEDVKAFAKFQEDINHELLATNHKIHFYPEASIEPYCRKLRNFKKGAFYFALQNNVPVVPMVFVYPKPRRLTLIVGKPIYPGEIEGIDEMKKLRAVIAVAQKSRCIMQNMMDDFYGGIQNEN